MKLNKRYYGSKLFFNKVGYIDDIGRILNTDFVINYSIENNKLIILAKNY